MGEETNRETTGIVMRDGSGDLYFISDETLNACRLSGHAAAEVQNVLDTWPDVQGFDAGLLPVPITRLALLGSGLELATNLNSSRDQPPAASPAPAARDGAMSSY